MRPEVEVTAEDITRARNRRDNWQDWLGIVIPVAISCISLGLLVYWVAVTPILRGIILASILMGVAALIPMLLVKWASARYLPGWGEEQWTEFGGLLISGVILGTLVSFFVEPIHYYYIQVALAFTLGMCFGRYSFGRPKVRTIGDRGLRRGDAGKTLWEIERIRYQSQGRRAED